MGGGNYDSNQPNGAIMVILTIISNVMLSEAEAECRELLYNAKELEALRTILIHMVNPQKSTEIVTDNSTADVIMKGTIKKNLLKPWTFNFIGYMIKWNKITLR